MGDGPEAADAREAAACDADHWEAEDRTLVLDEDTTLVISSGRPGLLRAANLVMAATRLRRRQRDIDSDQQMCSVVMESLLHERVIDCVDGLSLGLEKTTFKRVRTVSQCTLCDTAQRDIVQSVGGIQLQAITLKGGHALQRVRFLLSHYVSTQLAQAKMVTLALCNSSWYICCSVIDDKPALQLEQCCDEDLKEVDSGTIKERFLFFKRTVGVSLSSFESVKFRGWFISTSSEEENQAVEMSQLDAASRCTTFKMKM